MFLFWLKQGLAKTGWMHTDEAIHPEKIKKILCIKPRGIGDIILSTIIIDSLINSFPSAKIDYLTEEFARPSLENNPMVNKILTMGKTEFPLKVALRVRKEKYDLLLDLWSNPRSAQITFFSGVRYRTGFAYRGRKYAYNILATSSRGETHSAEHNLEILKPIGVPVVSKKIHYYVSTKDKAFADSYFKKTFSGANPVVGIIPAGGWESKRCDKEKWVEIISEYKKIFNAEFLILWGPGDEEDAKYIKQFLPFVVLAPSTDLNTMAALTGKCNLILANDSGPMHISAALGIPTIGIFGPTNPKAHGPYTERGGFVYKKDLHCIICNLLVCPYNHECMKELPLDELIKLSGNLLQIHSR
jgi:lipopolysaccharide heptosyltransferase II